MSNSHAKQLITLIILLIIPIASSGAHETDKVVSATPVIQATQQDQNVYYLQIRVIFAGKTGIYGNVVRELRDMKTILTKYFKYPSYELSNNIRLSLFGDEEAAALVFPDHYLRIIPKGTAKGDKLKAKVELYHVSSERDSRTRLEVGELGKMIQFQEKEKEGSHSKLFPIAGSAMILNPKQWEAFGGVPVRVNSQGRVSSNTMSSSPINQPGVSTALGQEKYLILGIQLDEVRK